MCDLKGIPFFVNRAGLAMVGLDGIEQACRTPVRDFFFPEDQGKVMDEFLPRVMEKGHGEIEVRFRHFKTGRARWMAYKVLTVTDAAGQPLALATVSQDVTERRQLEDNLRGLAAEMSEADRRKDEFLAMLAHELRNPLAPLSNAVQVLRLAGSDGEAVQSASEMLERQVAPPDAPGGRPARHEPHHAGQDRAPQGARRAGARSSQQAVEAARPLFGSMNHELTVAAPAQPVYLNADPTRLAQVVGNLLNNAAKFTDKGGHVWLTVERDGAQAAIRVRDTGIGIAAEQRPRTLRHVHAGRTRRWSVRATGWASA